LPQPLSAALWLACFLALQSRSADPLSLTAGFAAAACLFASSMLLVRLERWPLAATAAAASWVFLGLLSTGLAQQPHPPDHVLRYLNPIAFLCMRRGGGMAADTKEQRLSVLRLRYGKRTVLLPGEAEKDVERTMLADNTPADLHADIEDRASRQQKFDCS
jgi:hypothetical protein